MMTLLRTAWKFIGIFIKVIKNKPFSLFWTTMNRQTDYVVQETMIIQTDKIMNILLFYGKLHKVQLCHGYVPEKSRFCFYYLEA